MWHENSLKEQRKCRQKCGKADSREKENERKLSKKMSDPYQEFLGVDQSASDEEIKKAYRKLSRQYHPDANINNPHKDEAEAKFKEVQQAYQQIMDEREKGYSSSGAGGGSQGSGYGDYGPFGGLAVWRLREFRWLRERDFRKNSRYERGRCTSAGGSQLYQKRTFQGGTECP